MGTYVQGAVQRVRATLMEQLGVDPPFVALLTLVRGRGVHIGPSERLSAWLAVFAITSIALSLHSLPSLMRLVCAVGVPLSWCGIVWSTAKYLHEVDELSRLIQLEAAALAYGSVIVLAAVWYTLWESGGIAAVVVGLHPDAQHASAYLPILMLPVFLVAELLRGVALVLLARSRG